MILSTSTGALADSFGNEAAIEMLTKAGFDAFDFSLFKMSHDENYEMNGPNYREFAWKLRKKADLLGIRCNQAHAPFPSSYGEPLKDEIAFNKIVGAMEIASILGAKIIIVHPKQHLEYAENVEKLKQMNMKFYQSLIPYCKKYNIKVAIENMWQYQKNNKNIIESTCARAKEFCDYIDTINSEWVVAYLDVGHAYLVGADIAEFIRKLGGRLQALHIHDVDGFKDSHNLPFMEKIDFKPVLAALKEIGYKGDFTFEADEFLKRVPKGLMLQTAKYMCAVGRFLISEYFD